MWYQSALAVLLVSVGTWVVLGARKKKTSPSLPLPAPAPTTESTATTATAAANQSQIAEMERSLGQSPSTIASQPSVAVLPAEEEVKDEVKHAESPLITSKKGRVIVLSGPPGAGKGVQCKRLCSKYGFLHVSTGDIFRAAVRAKTQLGLLADTYIKRGSFVPGK